jgi:anti-sigma factor RsiW
MPAMPAECEAVADLLDALADGELPPPTAAEARRHLAGCQRCAAEFAAIGAFRRELAILRQETAPAGLADRIRASLPVAPGMQRLRFATHIAAGVAGVAAGIGGARWLAAPPNGADPAALARHDLLAAHARGLLAGLPLQVAAGDPHAVRPWLTARLPVAPRVEDPPGFPLQGARLDLVGGQAVAAVLYRRREHVVSVLATAADAARGWPRQPSTQQGFNLLPWIARGVHYVAVSDLNPAELAELGARLGAPAP